MTLIMPNKQRNTGTISLRTELDKNVSILYANLSAFKLQVCTAASQPSSERRRARSTPRYQRTKSILMKLQIRCKQRLRDTKCILDHLPSNSALLLKHLILEVQVNNKRPPSFVTQSSPIKSSLMTSI